MGVHETLSVYDYSRNKICDLYDSNIELIGQAYDIEVSKNWDGTHSLTFNIPYVLTEQINESNMDAARFGIAIFGIDRYGSSIQNVGNKNYRWMFLKSDYLIRYTCGDKNIWFVANKPKKSKSNKAIYGSVSCNGYETLLRTRNLYMVFNDENGIGTIGYLITRILRGTGWTFDSALSDTMLERDGTTEKIRSLKDDGKKGALDLIITVCNLFKARPIFDTDAMTVSVKAINHRTQVIEGEIGRNLTSLSVEPDSTDIVTRLYVEGEYGDYGYVGIDDVVVNGQPWGLPFLVNFDYYRSIGTFTGTHEAALETYLDSIRAKKAAIRANAALIITAEDSLNEAIGQCKLAVYYKENGTLVRKYTYGGITDTQAALSYGDDVYLLLNNGKYTRTTWSASTQINNAYGVAKFVTPSAGKIGAAEVQIEAKEKAIAQLQAKIDATASADRIAEYQAEKTRLQNEISALYDTASTGLYAMMYAVMRSDGMLYQLSQYEAINAQLNSDQDDIEATFIAAMGYMLRDGYWNDKNYTVGQEEYLYADALDMIDQMSKPKKTYSFSYIRVDDDHGIPAQDIGINAIFKIFDNELDIDDSMFVKKITYGVDKKSVGTIEVSNQDITLSNSDLGSLLSRMSQLADLIDQKSSLYGRAQAISGDNTIFAERLNGRIDVLRTRLYSTSSNWYTDDRGNIVFESAGGESAMMLSGAGFMIANGKDSNNQWIWRTFGTGEGFTADEIVAGFISAERIEAGTIAVSKLVSTAGADLDISNNSAVTNKYTKVTGITIESAGIDISGSQYVKIASGGYFQVETGTFGIKTDALDYVMWSGAATAASSPFWLMKDGSIKAYNADIKGTIRATTLYIGNTQASLTVDQNGKVELSSLASISLSNYTFDSLGNANGTGVYITPSLIRAKSTGIVDFSAAQEIRLKAGSISMAAISDYSPPDNMYEKQTGITIGSTGVDISGNKHINLDVDANNYVHLGSTGIVLKGTRVSVIDATTNEEFPMWGRDDIVVMKPGGSSSDWRSSIASIETHMGVGTAAAKHDWVLVRPYYNASIQYSQPASVDISTDLHMLKDPNEAFGDEATGYEYDVDIVFDLYPNGVVAGRPELEMAMWATNGSDTRKLTLDRFTPSNNAVIASSQQGYDIHIPANVGVSANNRWTCNLTYTARSSGSTYNLAGEGYEIHIMMYERHDGTTRPRLTSVSVTARCDASTTRVPCTVYYYP